MPDLVFLLEIVAIFALTYFLCLYILNKFILKKTKTEEEANKYIKFDDPKAQELYDKSIDKGINFSKDEKEELSWNFLYAITEVVFSKFSEKDKKELEEIGINLAKSGMVYQHDTKLGISKKELMSLSEELKNKKTKKQESSVSM